MEDKVKTIRIPAGYSAIVQQVAGQRTDAETSKAVNYNNDQSPTLASIRDALLPKLLSREIKVKLKETL